MASPKTHTAADKTRKDENVVLSVANNNNNMDTWIQLI